MMARTKKRHAWLVKNWRQAWKWFSTWSFMLIVLLATVPIPPEILNIMPERCREYVVAMVAVCGMLLRLINQSNTSKQGKIDE